MAKRNKTRTAKRTGRESGSSSKPMLFDRSNYLILILGIFLILVGFSIMRLENEVYGFISLYVAPIVIVSGYGTVIAAILTRRKKVTDLTE